MLMPAARPNYVVEDNRIPQQASSSESDEENFEARQPQPAPRVTSLFEALGEDDDEDEDIIMITENAVTTINNTDDDDNMPPSQRQKTQ